MICISEHLNKEMYMIDVYNVFVLVHRYVLYPEITYSIQQSDPEITYSEHLSGKKLLGHLSILFRLT
jgi:hypothetical protein